MLACSQIPSCRPVKGRAHLEPELALQLSAWHAAGVKSQGRSRSCGALKALSGSRREGETGGADTRGCAGLGRIWSGAPGAPEANSSGV